MSRERESFFILAGLDVLFRVILVLASERKAPIILLSYLRRRTLTTHSKLLLDFENQEDEVKKKRACVLTTRIEFFVGADLITRIILNWSRIWFVQSTAVPLERIVVSHKVIGSRWWCYVCIKLVTWCLLTVCIQEEKRWWWRCETNEIIRKFFHTLKSNIFFLRQSSVKIDNLISNSNSIRHCSLASCAETSTFFPSDPGYVYWELWWWWWKSEKLNFKRSNSDRRERRKWDWWMKGTDASPLIEFTTPSISRPISNVITFCRSIKNWEMKNHRTRVARLSSCHNGI